MLLLDKLAAEIQQHPQKAAEVETLMQQAKVIAYGHGPQIRWVALSKAAEELHRCPRTLKRLIENDHLKEGYDYRNVSCGVRDRIDINVLSPNVRSS